MSSSLKNDFDVANCPAVAYVHTHNRSNAVHCQPASITDGPPVETCYRLPSIVLCNRNCENYRKKCVLYRLRVLVRRHAYFDKMQSSFTKTQMRIASLQYV